MFALVAAWAAGLCSQHPPPVAKGRKEIGSEKRGKLLGDSTERAEEGVEVAQGAGGRGRCPHRVVWVSRYRDHRKTCCVFSLTEPWCGFSVSRLGASYGPGRVRGFPGTFPGTFPGSLPAAAEPRGNALSSAELTVKSFPSFFGAKRTQPWCPAVMDPFLVGSEHWRHRAGGTE